MSYIHKLWHEYETTIIMVTHEPVVAKYAQKIIMLKDGIVEKEIHQRHFHNHINEFSLKLK